MKSLTLILFGVSCVSSFLIKVPTAPSEPKIASNGWVHLQKLILPLFENVCEVSADPTIIRLAAEFDLDSSSGDYTKPDVIKNLQNYISSPGLMKAGEIFSEYNVDHLNELRVIFEVLYYAKDFSTFYKAAAWARQNVNCGLFVDVIYFAMLHRRDTAHLSLPPLYELLPNYFVRKPFIYKASALLSGNEVPLDDTTRGDGNSYIIDANYTSDYLNDDDESTLAYFREDIGLNSYYFLQKLNKCPWLEENSDINNRHGEYLYHMMKQLAARYSLEKYSHGLPDTDVLTWDSFTVPSYDPMLTYSNGDDFGHRISTEDLGNDADAKLLESIQNNIATVVMHMRDSGYNKTQIINHLMEILVTGDKNLEVAALNLIAKYTTDSQPSVLEHYMTALRDPAFWKLNKMVVNIVDNALKTLPTYTKSELYFPGLEIVSIDVKKMSTYFDNFQFDVTDALKLSATPTFQVKIDLPRLNHKAFTLKLSINSVTAQKGLIKIFLGPKTPPGGLVAYKNMFVLLDAFECSFKKGVNVISRSTDHMNLSNDYPSLKTLRKIVADAEFGLDVLPLTGIEPMLGFPSRLTIPKGTEEGLPVQIFVIVAPFVKISPNNMFLPSSIEYNSEVLSPGYPFDLDITDSQLFELPNALVKEVVITHKGDKASGNYSGSDYTKNYGGSDYTKNWQQSSLGGSASAYSGGKREPFDYKSKKGQYGKKKDVDYSAKREDNTKYTKQDLSTTTDNIVETVTNDENRITEIEHDTTTERISKKTVHLDKDIVFDMNDFNRDVENTINKFIKSAKDIEDKKVFANIDVTKDVHKSFTNKFDLDKNVNPPTHKYIKDITVDNIDKDDVDREVVVHVDTDYNKMDVDRIFPIHREGKDVLSNNQKDETAHKDSNDGFLVADSIDDDELLPEGPTTRKNRRFSVYDYLIHPIYDDDYSFEKVFE